MSGGDQTLVVVLVPSLLVPVIITLFVLTVHHMGSVVIISVFVVVTNLVFPQIN